MKKTLKSGAYKLELCLFCTTYMIYGQYHALFHGLDSVLYICISKLTIIGSDNGLSSGQHQAIIWTDTGILLIRTLGTNFSEILIEIQTFHPFNKMQLKMSVKLR